MMTTMDTRRFIAAPEEMEWDEPITRPGQKGDVAGHGFHGNRYTGGIGGGEETSPRTSHPVNLPKNTRSELVQTLLADAGPHAVTSEDYMHLAGKYLMTEQDVNAMRPEEYETEDGKTKADDFYRLEETMGDYETSDAWMMNMELRGGTDPSILSMSNHNVAEMDECFEKFGSAFDDDKVVFRGAIMDELPQKGEVYHDEAFISTINTPDEAIRASSKAYAAAVSEEVGEVTGSSTVWEITIPKGAQCLAVRPDEYKAPAGDSFQEVVLPRGVNLAVERTRTIEGVTFIKASYLGSTPKLPAGPVPAPNHSDHTVGYQYMGKAAPAVPPGRAWRVLWLPGDMTITRPGAKGDVAGHGFHGNRYTGGIGGGEAALAHEVYASETAARNKLGAGATFASEDSASDYAGKLYDEYAPTSGAYRSNAQFGSPIEVRFGPESHQSGVARVAEGAAVYPVITLGDGMHDQLTIIHEVSHIIANEREQGLTPWKANHGGVFRDTFRNILRGEMLAHAEMIKSIERTPGQKGEGTGHAFRGNRWTGGIGSGGKVTGPPKLVSSKVKPGPKALTYEKMTPGQREAVHHIALNMTKATNWGWKYGNGPTGLNAPSQPLNPNERNSVIGAVKSLEMAGIDHEQLVRALAMDAGMNRIGHAGSGAVTAYTVQQYSQDLQSLEHSQRPDFHPAELVPSKIEVGRAEALAEEVMRPVRLAQFAAIAKEAQGSHLAAGLADPTKFPSFARESLTAIAQLAARDGMLYNDHIPEEGKNVDRMYTENHAALMAVGRDVQGEIDRRIAAIPPPDPRVLLEANDRLAVATHAADVASYDWRQIMHGTADIRNFTDWMRLPKDDPMYIAKNEEYERANAQVRELRAVWDGLNATRIQAEMDVRAAKGVDRLAGGKIAIQVLSEIRPFGYDLKYHIGDVGRGAKPAVASFQRAAAYFPSEWYDRAFGRTINAGRVQWQMNIAVSAKPTGSASQVSTYRSNRGAELVDSTSVHETGHFMEDIGGRSLEQAEYKFMLDRTTNPDGTREQTRSLDTQNRARGLGRWTRSSDRSAQAYADKFASVYMGKLYGEGGPKSNYELLTMGMENLRNPTSNSPQTDAEYKAWMLGVLATL